MPYLSNQYETKDKKDHIYNVVNVGIHFGAISITDIHFFVSFIWILFIFSIQLTQTRDC